MDLTISINRSVDLDEVLRLVRDTVVTACGFDRAGIFLYDQTRKVMRGACGTDRDGRFEDLRQFVFELNPADAAVWGITSAPSQGVIFTPDFAAAYEPAPGDAMHGVHASGIVHMRANDMTVGFIAVDNLLTQRPFTRQDLEELVPFASQAALAIEKAILLEEREASLDRQQRLMRMATAIAAEDDPDQILHLVRDAVIETGIVDRVGVWTVDGDFYQGSWGTTVDGELADEHDLRFRMENLQHLHEGDDRLHFDVGSVEMPDGSFQEGVPHVILALRASGELVGILTADTLLTFRPLTPEHLEPLLPFAEQAAIAIQKGRMLREQKLLLQQQRRLMQMATAISGNHDLDAIFRLVREAVIETGVIDRAGAWMVDGKYFQGTWGTSTTGELLDEHDIRHLIADSGETVRMLQRGDSSVILTRTERVTMPDGEIRENVPYAIIALRASDELFGVLTVDTLFTMRPLTEESLQPLIPFAEQAAVAIQKAALLEERSRIVQRQKRLMQMAAAICGFNDLNSIYRIVREAILENGWIDRISIWTIDGDGVRGTLGEDETGFIDETDVWYAFDICSHAARQVIHEGASFAINLLPLARFHDGREGETVPHAVLALRARGELQGILSLDAIFSSHEIASSDVELLMPFADQTAIAMFNAKLEREVSERTRSLEESHAESLERLARAAAYKDDATGAHTARIRDYCYIIGRSLGLDIRRCLLLRRASELHDLGKIGIPDAILNKAGQLTPEEFEIVKQHPTIGADLLAGGKTELIQSAEMIAVSHHERWDGRGYPAGLKGEDIPLFARIVAVADVLDALTSKRPYKECWSLDDAMAEIARGSGTQFDPAVVEALGRAHDQIKEAFTRLDKTPETTENPWLESDYSQVGATSASASG